LAAGASAGIAYHLLVDAYIQPAPYHSLPLSMPIEGHQAAMAANGAAERLDAARRFQARRGVEIAHGGLPEKSTGRTVVDGIVSAASAARSATTKAVERAKAHWRNRRKET